MERLCRLIGKSDRTQGGESARIIRRDLIPYAADIEKVALGRNLTAHYACVPVHVGELPLFTVVIHNLHIRTFCIELRNFASGRTIIEPGNGSLHVFKTFHTNPVALLDKLMPDRGTVLAREGKLHCLISRVKIRIGKVAGFHVFIHPHISFTGRRPE